MAGSTDSLPVSHPAKDEAAGLRLIWEIPMTVQEQTGAGLGKGVPPTQLRPDLGTVGPACMCA